MSDGWEVVRLKYIAECNRDVLTESTEGTFAFRYIDIGSVTQGAMDVDVPLVTFADAPSRARRLAEPGDIVVSTVRTYLRAVSTVPSSDDPLVFSTGFAVLHPGPKVEARFLAYYLQSDNFVDRVVAHSDGVSYPAITARRLMGFDLRMPPLPRQRTIADHLDLETARLDELITSQRALISLLRDRRAAVVAGVFADRVGSGERLKWAFDEVDHRAGLTGDALPLLSVSISWGVRRRDEITNDAPRADDLSGYKRCAAGHLVLNRMRAFQGALGIAPEDGIVSPDYAVLHVRPGVSAEWLAALMRSAPFIAEMTSRIRGIGTTEGGNVRTPRINVSDLSEIRVAIPAPHVQLEDLGRLTESTQKIDALISTAERFLALAAERRTALITAVVTGAVEVEGLVA